jgi:beta-galactosidase GanA
MKTISVSSGVFRGPSAKQSAYGPRKMDGLYDRDRNVIQEAGIKRVLDTDLPEGVTAQVRTDGVNDYVFLLNFSDRAQDVTLDRRDYADMLVGGAVGVSVELPLHGDKVLKRHFVISHRKTKRTGIHVRLAD